MVNSDLLNQFISSREKLFLFSIFRKKKFDKFWGDVKMRVYILPTFKGFTIDVRLKEFRRIDDDQGLLFIPFNSKEGQELISEMREYFEFLYL